MNYSRLDFGVSEMLACIIVQSRIVTRRDLDIGTLGYGASVVLASMTLFCQLAWRDVKRRPIQWPTEQMHRVC